MEVRGQQGGAGAEVLGSREGVAQSRRRRPLGQTGETGSHPTWSRVFPKSEPQAISPAELAMWGLSVWGGNLGWGSLPGDSL